MMQRRKVIGAGACSGDIANRARLWFVCARYGQSTKPYLNRQLVGLAPLSPRLVTWENSSTENHKFEPLELRTAPEPYGSRRDRLWWRFRHLGMPNGYSSVGRERDLLESLAANDRPDVILAHLGQFALRLAPVVDRQATALVCHFHGVDTYPMSGERVYMESLRKLLPTFDAVVVVSEQQRMWVEANGALAGRIHVIPCGAPVLPLPRRPLDAAPVFIAVSTLTEVKGLSNSVDAFAKVAKHSPSAHLQIIGEGPLRPVLEIQVADLGLAHRITFLGAIAPEQTQKLIRKADIFVQHSLDTPTGPNEGTSVAINEASAAGMPAVVTDCGGNADLVVDGKTGFVVTQRDTEGMAAAMIRLAEDPALRASMGENAHNWVKENFNAEHQVRKLSTVLESFTA